MAGIIKDTKTALIMFEESAVKHTEATETGDHKIGNKHARVILNVVKYLSEKKEIHELSRFLDHESAGVRIWAATYLLSVSEREAVSVLQKAAHGTGLVSLGAETVLNERKKGTLKL